MPKWDSTLYSKFINERTQPAYDLASRINVANPKTIIDIGCGPGNSTLVLNKLWPDADISAFDSSDEMLKQAKEQPFKVNWFQSTVEDWNPTNKYDIIFSNAVLQWVSLHEILLPHLLDTLNDGGVLAVQMPAHYNSPLHKELINLAKIPQYKEYTESACEQLSLKPPSYYYDVLKPVSSHIEMWETQYIHIMDNVQSILEWFRGTGLRPFMEALPNNDIQVCFEKELLKKYEESYIPQKNGKVLFPFNRYFLIAYK